MPDLSVAFLLLSIGYLMQVALVIALSLIGALHPTRGAQAFKVLRLVKRPRTPLALPWTRERS